MRLPRPTRVATSVAGLACVAVLAFRAFCEPAADGLPKAYENSRYASLRAKSPFALASAPAATPAPQASFATNWFVSGIGRIGQANFVSIKSRDLSSEFSLFEGEPKKADEVALVSVNWSDEVGKSTVVLRKGNETAHLEFNEAELHSTPAPNAKPVTNVPLAPGQWIATPMPKPFKAVPRLTGPGHPPPAVKEPSMEDLQVGDAVPTSPR